MADSYSYLLPPSSVTSASQPARVASLELTPSLFGNIIFPFPSKHMHSKELPTAIAAPQTAAYPGLFPKRPNVRMTGLLNKHT